MNKNIIIIISFVLILLICNCNIIDNFNNYSKNNRVYRLGDIIKIKDFRNEIVPKNVYSKKITQGDYHLKYFPDSIASEYLSLTKDKADIDILNKIIDRRTKKYHLKYQNYIVVHLRTGDVMTRKNCKSHNIIPLNYYEEIVKQIKKTTKNKKILIVSGFHIKENLKKSNEYIKNVKKIFKKNNFKVKLRIDNNPDDDFIIMSNSKHFVQSCGGYSLLVSKIVKKKGNNVYSYNE